MAVSITLPKPHDEFTSGIYHHVPPLLSFNLCNTSREISRQVQLVCKEGNVSLASIQHKSQPWRVRKLTKYRIAFGDSYTYVQGTHGRQNYSFIGDQFNYAYDAQTLLSDMIVQNQVRTRSHQIILLIPRYRLSLTPNPDRNRRRRSKLDRIPHKLRRPARHHLTTQLQKAALGLCLCRRRHINRIVR